jgi:hypothetical protein
LVAVVALHLTQEPHQQELQLAVLVVLVIYLQAVLVQVQELTQAVQVVAVADTSPQAVTHQATQAVLVEMVAVAVAVPTTQEQAVLAVTAYFIFTTKRGKQWQHMQ